MESNSDEASGKESGRQLVQDLIASNLSSSSFYLAVKGQVIGGLFPGDDNLYCKYCFFYGEDWQIVSGQEESCSQIAVKSSNSDGKSVWNVAIDVTFRSTNPFRWPSLIVSVYGVDSFGNDVVRGYATTHLPSIAGHHDKQLPAFVPRSSSLMNAFHSWFSGKKPEFSDSRIVAQGKDRAVVRVSTKGMVFVSMDIILKDFHKHGFKSR